MNNKINEFIEELLPPDINHSKKEDLRQELENHILDAIEFYEENGFSYEKSVEKALSDFCEDEETKKKIKFKFVNLHSKNSLAKYIIKISLLLILICVFSDLYIYHILQPSLTLIIIQIMLISTVAIIERIKKIPRIIRSIVSIIILIIFTYISLFFSFLLPKDSIEIKTTNIDEFYNQETITYYGEETEQTYSFIPSTTELGEYTNATRYFFTVKSIFTEPYNSTYIFSYSENEYFVVKNYINEKYVNFDKNLNLYGFEFKYFSPLNCKYDFMIESEYRDKYHFFEDDIGILYFIGTNDETKQIAIMCCNDEYLEYVEFSKPIKEIIIANEEEQEQIFFILPDKNEFDEVFYSDTCGWKYISFFNFFLK